MLSFVIFSRFGLFWSRFLQLQLLRYYLYVCFKRHNLCYRILQLLNRRQLERLKEKWWNSNPKAIKCEKQDDQSDGISIQNIGGVFIVIFVGIGLACITLAFEYWWYKYRKVSKVISVQEAPAKHSFQAAAKMHNQHHDKEDLAKKVNKLYPRSRF